MKRIIALLSIITVLAGLCAGCRNISDQVTEVTPAVTSPEPTEILTSAPEPTVFLTSAPEPIEDFTSAPKPTVSLTSVPEPTEAKDLTSTPEPTEDQSKDDAS